MGCDIDTQITAVYCYNTYVWQVDFHHNFFFLQFDRVIYIFIIYIFYIIVVIFFLINKYTPMPIGYLSMSNIFYYYELYTSFVLNTINHIKHII